MVVSLNMPVMMTQHASKEKKKNLRHHDLGHIMVLLLASALLFAVPCCRTRGAICHATAVKCLLSLSTCVLSKEPCNTTDFSLQSMLPMLVSWDYSTTLITILRSFIRLFFETENQGFRLGFQPISQWSWVGKNGMRCTSALEVVIVRLCSKSPKRSVHSCEPLDSPILNANPGICC